MATRKKKAAAAAAVAATPVNPMGNDPWPSTVAAKVIASYIHLKFDLSAADLMFFNPPMGAMPFFNNSASKEIRHAELALVAGKMLRFLTDLRIPLEAGTTAAQAHAALLAAMEDETGLSSEMGVAVDEHYRFVDEEDA
jgi:hypothetical protein